MGIDFFPVVENFVYVTNVLRQLLEDVCGFFKSGATGHPIL